MYLSSLLIISANSIYGNSKNLFIIIKLSTQFFSLSIKFSLLNTILEKSHRPFSTLYIALPALPAIPNSFTKDSFPALKSLKLISFFTK